MTKIFIALCCIGVISISSHASAGFFEDIGDLGQGVIDNVRGKESKDNKKLDRAIQKPIDAVKKPVEKADEKISDAWNEWREEKVDPIGDYIAMAYKYLKAGYKGSPDGFPAEPKKPLNNVDIQISLNSSILNNLFSQFISEQIPLDKDNPNNGNYIYFDDMNLTTDASRRVLILKVSRGRLRFDFVTRNTLKVNGATMEFLPSIRRTGGKMFLDLNSRMTYLNVDDVLPMVERGISHGINDYLKSKDGANGFISIDLTDKFGKSIEMPTVDKDFIELSLSATTIFIDENSVIFQARFGTTKNIIIPETPKGITKPSDNVVDLQEKVICEFSDGTQAYITLLACRQHGKFVLDQ